MTRRSQTEVVSLKRRADVAERMLDGSLTLLGAAGRQVHLLNESAAEIWNAIGDGTTLDGLVSTIAERFVIDEATLRADIVDSLPGFADLVEIDLDREMTTPRDALAGSECRAPIKRGSGGRRIGPFRALESTVVIEVAERVGQASDTFVADLRAVLAPLIRTSSSNADGVGGAGSDPLITLRVDQIDRDSPIPQFVLERNGEPVTRVPTVASLRAVVLAEVNAAPIAALRESVGWHAGAVEFPAGVVVFPGRSNAGKSTLVTQLVQRGHGYLTDEAVAIGVASAEVRSFPKSVCVDHGGKSLFAELAPPHQIDWPTWHVDPNRIGPGRLGEPGRPLAFVFPTYDGSPSVSLERLTRREALEALLENSFDFAQAGEAGAALMLLVADEIPCYQLRHGGQPEHIALLEERFA